MSDAVLALVSTIAGAAIALGGSYLRDRHNSRDQQRQRWDEQCVNAVIELALAAMDAEGLEYRRGRAIATAEQSIIDRRTEEAADGSKLFRAAALRAELLLPPLHEPIDAVRDANRGLRNLADQGLIQSDERWQQLRDANQLALRSLNERARHQLGLETRGASR